MSTEITVADDRSQMFSLIERALTDPAITPEKLHGLLDFKERLDAKAAETEANAAFARAVKNMPVIKKHGMIDFGKGAKPIPYAKFEEIQEAIRPIYEAEGFVVTFDSEPRDNMWTTWYAIATHANGHTRRAGITLPLDTSGGKQNIQGAGSTSQYGKRYSAAALFNLRFEGEDDDGVRGGMRFITLDQCKQINELLTQTSADVHAFLRTFEVAEVANLQEAQFVPAMNLLRAKQKKQAKA